MSLLDPVTADPAPLDPVLGGIIKLAVLAVGGQGGGVLTGWIEATARAQGYVVQATSVAGVAQRTGATVYYIEMCPASARQPVFSLMPAAGDVDVMITAEMMEAGRAILRGFVTPDRTTLITSTHRALAVSEKMVPGDGIASSAEVMAAAEVAARRLIAADFDALATDAGSVISASLFGALAGSGALPFPGSAFEAAIGGAAASLRAYHAGFTAVTAQVQPVVIRPAVTAPTPLGPQRLRSGWNDLRAKLADLPAPVAAMALAGLQKVVDYQDIAYGEAYLARLADIVKLDQAERGFVLATEAAKYLANAMCYDDVIRVADLKTRAGRMMRIRDEMGMDDGKVMQLTDYMHPRAEEIVGMLPSRLGARLEASPNSMARIGRWFGKGRHLRTDGLLAYLMLYALAGLRSRRRGNLRHAQETRHREQWLDWALGFAPNNYDLAVEAVRCRRLIKGYSDTHARGLSKFDRVKAGVTQIAGREDAADWARRLREAALQDEEGLALDGALKTIASFT